MEKYTCLICGEKFESGKSNVYIYAINAKVK